MPRKVDRYLSECAVSNQLESDLELQTRIAHGRAQLMMVQVTGSFLGMAGALFVAIFVASRDFFSMAHAGSLVIFVLLSMALMVMLANKISLRISAAEDTLLDRRVAREDDARRNLINSLQTAPKTNRRPVRANFFKWLQP